MSDAPATGDLVIEVRDDPDRSRYLVEVDGEHAGLVSYRLEPGRIRFTHTETDARWQGKGVASTLASEVLADARRRGLAVVPQCPFIRGYLASHRELLDLVPADVQAEYDLD